MDRSVSPDIHWCYRVYYKSHRAKTNSGPKKPPVHLDVYTEQRINAAESSLRQLFDGWCERLRRSPGMLLPVCERLVSKSEQVGIGGIFAASAELKL